MRSWFPGIPYNYFSDGIPYNLITSQKSEGKHRSSMISIHKSTHIADLKNKSSMSTRESVTTSHFLQLFLVILHVCFRVSFVHHCTWDCTFATLGLVSKYIFTITGKDVQVKSMRK